MATTVDLNCDMGESFGAYKIGLDEEVAKYISSANVACGFHASDPVVMDKTVKILKENNVNLGAHPGYPDLMGFGRRNMNVSPADAKAYVMYQIGALSAFAKANGLKIQHVKPHGALYNTPARTMRCQRQYAREYTRLTRALYFSDFRAVKCLKPPPTPVLNAPRRFLPTGRMRRTALLLRGQSRAQS